MRNLRMLCFIAACFLGQGSAFAQESTMEETISFVRDKIVNHGFKGCGTEKNKGSFEVSNDCRFTVKIEWVAGSDRFAEECTADILNIDPGNMTGRPTGSACYGISDSQLSFSSKRENVFRYRTGDAEGSAPIRWSALQLGSACTLGFDEPDLAARVEKAFRHWIKKCQEKEKF